MFLLTVEDGTDGWRDGWMDTKMMLGQALSLFRIPLTGLDIQNLNKIIQVVQEL